MLHRLRHARRLHAATVAVFVLAWLLALWASLPTRSAVVVLATAPATAQAAPLSDPLVWQEVCGQTPLAELMAHWAGAQVELEPGHGHDGHHPHHNDSHAPHAGHDHHADCLLCIPWMSPLAAPGLLPYAPVLQAHRARASIPARLPVWHAQAPLPARGPPSPFHA